MTTDAESPLADLARLACEQQRTIQLLVERGVSASPSTGQQEALAVVKTVAQELRAAGETLIKAAERLLKAGDGHMAGQTRQAGLRALEQAEALHRA